MSPMQFSVLYGLTITHRNMNVAIFRRHRVLPDRAALVPYILHMFPRTRCLSNVLLEDRHPHESGLRPDVANAKLIREHPLPDTGTRCGAHYWVRYLVCIKMT